MEDRFYWAALHAVTDLGPRSLLHLYRHFRSGKDLLNAGDVELQQVPRLSTQAIEKILFFKRYADPQKIYQEFSEGGIGLAMLDDRDYPQGLAEIADPPVMLYLRGRLPPAGMPLMAVVGARQATPYGLSMAGRLAHDLALNGLGVVSGMARGVDTAAHSGALAANGYTLAVLGCGINICYPRENQKLRDRIQETGGVVSEFPPAASPVAKNFPIRNRIISGCSLGTLVVEAGVKSGALITAYQSLEQGRDVFAVPGPVTSARSVGANSLIKQGAKLVETVEDILVEFPYLQRVNAGESPAPQSVQRDLPGDEGVILKRLSLEPLHIDQIAEITGLTVSVVGGLLTMLEVKGLARRLPGHYFIIDGNPL